MSTHYDLLTDAEQASWNAYGQLREISDWAGYTDEQDERKLAERAWLQERRKDIWRSAQSEEDGGDGNGWDHANRRERYETLKDSNLNTAKCQMEAELPATWTTDTECALIEEREMWWRVTSQTDEQRARKQACTDWLVERRRKLWRDLDSAPTSENAENHRRERWECMCIATKTGSPYDEWLRTHDPTTGEALASYRQRAMDHMERRVGYTESPSGSNCDSRNDGIRTAQDHTAGGGTWLRYQPWCGCWCYYALEDAGVAGIDSHLASVAQIEDYARQGAKCYRGWTTDLRKAQRGDLVVIGGYGVHVEMVRGDVQSDGGIPTYGGNTSPGTGGSQSNGGGAYKRVRSRGEVRGVALIDYPA